MRNLLLVFLLACDGASTTTSDNTTGGGNTTGSGGNTTGGGGNTTGSGGNTTGSGGNTTGSGGGITVLSLTTSPAQLVENGSVTISAIVTDTAGLAAVAGGTFSDAGGVNYGAFSTAGGQGTFALTLTWTQVQQLSAINLPTGGGVRALIATFFDNGGNSAQKQLSLPLRCNRSADGACDGVCTNLSSDARNCGTCGNVLPAGQQCFNGMPVTVDPHRCDSCNSAFPGGGGLCETQINACNADSTCKAILSCANNCLGDATCMAQCRGQTVTASVVEYDAVISCVCGICQPGCVAVCL